MNRPSTTTAATTAIAVTVPAAPRTNILLARAVALAVAAALLVTAMFATGCKDGGNSAARTGDASASAGVGAARATSDTPVSYGTLVKSGPSPLNYRLGSAGVLRIVDTTVSDNALLVTTPIPAGANVNINDAKGITVAGSIIKPGPLPARHRYAIWLDSTKQQ